VSDRQNDVLNAIDTALDGALDDLTVSGDAMRWNPDGEEPCTCTVAEPCGQHIPLPPDSFAADMQRLSDAFRELGRTVRDEFARALGIERRFDELTVIVPDQTERDAYLEAADGNIDRAIELAAFGIPPALAKERPGAEVLDLPREANS
jgi:hypothetical protein